MAKDPTRKVTSAGSINRIAIEKLAYEYWLNRGCPEGSADHDWLEAERALQTVSNSRAARSTRASGKTMQAAG